MAKRDTIQRMQVAVLWPRVEALREQIESTPMTDAEIRDLVCKELDFSPPMSAINNAIKDHGITVAPRPRQKSDAKMLGEILGLVINKMAGGAPDQAGVANVAAQLIDGNIQGAYTDRGPLVF